MNRIYVGQVLQIPSKGGAPRPAKPRPPVAAAPALKPAPGKPTPAPEEPVVPDSIREVLTATADTLPSRFGRQHPRLHAMERFDVEVYGLETTLLSSPDMAEIHVSVNETIGHYADWLGIPTWRIRTLNHMRGRSGIRVGQSLLIPLDSAHSLETFAKTRLEYHMALEEDFYSRFKVVDAKARTIHRGENLWDICSAEGDLPLWLFKKYNKQVDLQRLMAGMVVWLPVVEEKTEEDIALEQLEYGGIYPPYYEPVRPTPMPPALLP